MARNVLKFSVMATMFFSLFCVFFLGGGVFVWYQAANAVEGYEDGTGFHNKTPQNDLMTHGNSSDSDAEWHRIVHSSEASISSLPVSFPSR